MKILDRLIFIYSRLGDDNALNAKVQEALKVYDDYMRGQGHPENPDKSANADGESKLAEEAS